MSGPAHLSGHLPDGEANGLAAIAADLIDHPAEVRVVVALLDTAKVTEDFVRGGRVATVRIRRVEVITDPADRTRLRHLLVREFERRTGRAVLPLDMEDELRDALAAGTDDEGEPDEQPST